MRSKLVEDGLDKWHGLWPTSKGLAAVLWGLAFRMEAWEKCMVRDESGRVALFGFSSGDAPVAVDGTGGDACGAGGLLIWVPVMVQPAGQLGSRLALYGRILDWGDYPSGWHEYEVGAVGDRRGIRVRPGSWADGNKRSMLKIGGATIGAPHTVGKFEPNRAVPSSVYRGHSIRDQAMIEFLRQLPLSGFQ